MSARALGHILIVLAAPRKLRDDVVGDLQERYRQAARRTGPGRATLAFYHDVLTSIVPLAFLRFRSAFRDAPLRAVAIGCAACAAVYLMQAAADRAGIESLVAAHAIVASVTIAACACASRRPYAAAFTMYAAIVGSALLPVLLGPERRELGEVGFYWPFVRIAVTIAVCSSLVRSLRRRFVRQES